MRKYTLRRLAKFFSTIWLIAVVTFFLIDPQLFDRQLYCTDRGCKGVIPEVVQRIVRAQDKPLVQRFFSYMLIDMEGDQWPEIGRLDFGVFGVYQIGREGGATLACGAMCLNFGPSYSRRGKDVEDILFGPLP